MMNTAILPPIEMRIQVEMQVNEIIEESMCGGLVRDGRVDLNHLSGLITAAFYHRRGDEYMDIGDLTAYCSQPLRKMIHPLGGQLARFESTRLAVRSSGVPWYGGWMVRGKTRSAASIPRHRIRDIEEPRRRTQPLHRFKGPPSMHLFLVPQTENSQFPITLS
jgi:hypothetical protein